MLTAVDLVRHAATLSQELTEIFDRHAAQIKLINGRQLSPRPVHAHLKTGKKRKREVSGEAPLLQSLKDFEQLCMQLTAKQLKQIGNYRPKHRASASLKCSLASTNALGSSSFTNKQVICKRFCSLHVAMADSLVSGIRSMIVSLSYRQAFATFRRKNHSRGRGHGKGSASVFRRLASFGPGSIASRRRSSTMHTPSCEPYPK